MDLDHSRFRTKTWDPKLTCWIQCTPRMNVFLKWGQEKLGGQERCVLIWTRNHLHFNNKYIFGYLDLCPSLVILQQVEGKRDPKKDKPDIEDIEKIDKKIHNIVCIIGKHVEATWTLHSTHTQLNNCKVQRNEYLYSYSNAKMAKKKGISVHAELNLWGQL